MTTRHYIAGVCVPAEFQSDMIDDELLSPFLSTLSINIYNDCPQKYTV